MGQLKYWWNKAGGNCVENKVLGEFCYNLSEWKNYSYLVETKLYILDNLLKT